MNQCICVLVSRNAVTKYSVEDNKLNVFLFFFSVYTTRNATNWKKKKKKKKKTHLIISAVFRINNNIIFKKCMPSSYHISKTSVSGRKASARVAVGRWIDLT